MRRVLNHGQLAVIAGAAAKINRIIFFRARYEMTSLGSSGSDGSGVSIQLGLAVES
jgi:hypothetical protein